MYRHGDGLSDPLSWTQDGLVRLSRDRKTVVVAIKASQEKIRHFERANGIYDAVKRSAELDPAIKQFYQALRGRPATDVLPQLNDTDSIHGVRKSDIAASYLINGEYRLKHSLFAKQASVGYVLVRNERNDHYSVANIFAVGDQGASAIRQYYDKNPDRAHR